MHIVMCHSTIGYILRTVRLRELISLRTLTLWSTSTTKNGVSEQYTFVGPLLYVCQSLAETPFFGV